MRELELTTRGLLLQQGSQLFRSLDITHAFPLGDSEIVYVNTALQSPWYDDVAPFRESRREIGFRRDEGRFTIYRSLPELREAQRSLFTETWLAANASAFAQFLAMWLDLGRAVYPGCLVESWLEGLEPLPPKPISDGPTLSFCALRLESPYPRLFRHTFSLEDFSCKRHFLGTAVREFSMLP